MKKIFLILGVTFMFSCGNKQANQSENETKFDVFGEVISEENAIEATLLNSQLEGKDTVEVKLKTKINEICQKKGCWMNVDLGNNEEMTVRFKDYGFFVPKDAAGREVIFEGMAYRDTVSVEDLRHYAEDEGKSAEEIAQIKEPEITISFEASGVLIKK